MNEGVYEKASGREIQGWQMTLSLAVHGNSLDWPHALRAAPLLLLRHPLLTTCLLRYGSALPRSIQLLSRSGAS